MKELFKKHAYPCCLVWLLCVGVIISINTYYDLGVNEIFLGFFAIICIILIRLFDVNKKNAMPYCILVFLALLIGIILYTADFSFKIEFAKYQIWLNDIFYGESELQIWYSIFTVGLLILALSLVISILVKKYKVRIVIAIILFVILILCSIFRVSVSKFGVCCFLTYLILMIVETKLFYFYEKANKSGAQPMPFLLPLFVIFIFVTSLLPMKQTPIEWKLIKQCIQTISDTIDNWVVGFDLWKHPEKVDFSVSFTGFSEDGDVGGNLKENNDKALHIKATNSISNNIYLSGNMKNNFDGSKWTNEFVSEGPKEQDEYTYDVCEMLYAINRVGTELEPKSIYNISNMDITYEDIHTRSLFYPSKTIYCLSNHSQDQIIDEYDGKRFKKTMGDGNTYRISYMNLNLGSEYFNELVKKQENFRYSNGESASAKEFLESVQSNYSVLGKSKVQDNFEQQLFERAAYIRQNYTQVYDGLPQRVKDLAQNITKDCTSDYEKLIALENYFSTYTYTRTPKQPAEGQDLVDYVLFESKEGYCSYYATAFAVMARCLNIPTMYIQGFCIETKDLKTYEYDAFNRDAHAWVEAYIEGIGWLPFEPTPTYSNQRYQPWKYEKVDASSQSVSPTPFYQDKDAKELKHQEEIRNRREAYRSIGAVLGIILLIIVISIPMYFGIKFSYLKKKYERSSLEGKVYSDIRKILYIFESCHRKREMSETFSKYMEYIYQYYPEQEKQLRKVEIVFHRLRYNNMQPSQEEQLEIAQLEREIFKESKSVLNKSQYFKLWWHLLSNSLG